jgi:hypothetical protein
MHLEINTDLLEDQLNGGHIKCSIPVELERKYRFKIMMKVLRKQVITWWT